MPRPLRFAVLVAAFAALYAVYCRALGIHIDFLQAESGVFLQHAFASEAVRSEYIRKFALHSYNGHFLPVAFFAEFEQARLFGASERAWFCRQMIAAGFVAASLSWLAARSAADAPKAYRWIVGACAGTLFLCQPIMLEIVTWPFMILQLSWFGLVAWSCIGLMNYVSTRRATYIGAAVLCGYLTMQCFGVGLASSLTAIGMALVLCKLRPPDKPARARLYIALSVAATLIHAALMLYTAKASAIDSAPLSLADNANRLGMLLIDSVYAGLRALWGPGGMVWPKVDAPASEAVYGFGLVLLLIAVTIAIARRALTSALPLGFALSTFLIYVALIIFRLRATHETIEVLGFLIGPRYVIFPSFFIVLTCCGLSGMLWRAFGKTAAGIPVVVAITALAGTAVFSNTLMHQIFPYVYINSQLVWNEAVEEARADLSQGRPIGNVSFGQLDTGFHTTLKDYAPMLAHYLKVSPHALTFAPN